MVAVTVELVTGTCPLASPTPPASPLWYSPKATVTSSPLPLEVDAGLRKADVPTGVRAPVPALSYGAVAREWEACAVRQWLGESPRERLYARLNASSES